MMTLVLSKSRCFLFTVKGGDDVCNIYIFFGVKMFSLFIPAAGSLIVLPDFLFPISGLAENNLFFCGVKALINS